MRLQFTVSSAQRSILSKLAKDYGCDVPELARVAVEELIAAHEQPRRRAPKRKAATRKAAAPRKAVPPVPPPQTVSGRTYADKPCAACGKPFTPTGPNAKVCRPCRASFAADAGRQRGEELEKVWDGTIGRRGASLTSH